MSDQQQILRLLATIREEVADIRSRQEELYEILLSNKDQIQGVEKAVVEGLQGLPTSPYIAGQLVPAPQQIEGVDEFGAMLATYLHKAPRGSNPLDTTPPADATFDPPVPVEDEDIKLEKNLDEPKRRRRFHGDSDLERGPERDVVSLGDLEDDDDGGKKKKRRRRRRRSPKRKSESSGEAETATADADD